MSGKASRELVLLAEAVLSAKDMGLHADATSAMFTIEYFLMVMRIHGWLVAIAT